MIDIFKKTTAPLLSLFIFVLGSGFFLTVLSLVMNTHHESPALIGSMSGFYYAGLMYGAFRLERFIIRVGHIRAFSTFASSLAVVTILHGIFYHMYFWMFLRFIGGFATAGIFVVIESLLLCHSTIETRGRILSLYMITFYLAQALGQLIVKLGHTEDLITYGITAMLCSLSVIPLSMTYVAIPQIDSPSKMGLKALYKKTISGSLGCFLAGMLLSATYALLPTLLATTYDKNTVVSVLMFCYILGGALFQYPIGKLSDKFDRRLVVVFVSSIMFCAALILFMYFNIYWVALLLITLFGGMAFTIYPISISHACDTLDLKDIVAGIQGLLFSYSIGATMGPFAAPIFMQFFGSNGLFLYCAIISAIILSVFSWRRRLSESPPQEEPFQIMTQTTPVIIEIDPRTDKE